MHFNRKEVPQPALKSSKWESSGKRMKEWKRVRRQKKTSREVKNKEEPFFGARETFRIRRNVAIVDFRKFFCNYICNYTFLLPLKVCSKPLIVQRIVFLHFLHFSTFFDWRVTFKQERVRIHFIHSFITTISYQ